MKHKHGTATFTGPSHVQVARTLFQTFKVPITAWAGISVVVIGRGARPLRSFEDLVERLIHRGAEAGVQVRRRTSLTSVRKARQGYRMRLTNAG